MFIDSGFIIRDYQSSKNYNLCSELTCQVRRSSALIICRTKLEIQVMKKNIRKIYNKKKKKMK